MGASIVPVKASSMSQALGSGLGDCWRRSRMKVRTCCWSGLFYNLGDDRLAHGFLLGYYKI